MQLTHIDSSNVRAIDSEILRHIYIENISNALGLDDLEIS